MKEESSLIKEIQELLAFYDNKANQLKSKFERIWISGVFAGVIAVFVFAIITIYKSSLSKLSGGFILPIVEVVLIIYSFIALGKIASKIKQRFIDARRSAEILRIHELFHNNKLPLKTSSFKESNYKVPQDILDIEFKSNRLHKEAETPFNEKATLEAIKFFIDGQKKYHSKERIKKFHKREHHLEMSLQIILWSFLAIIILKLGVELSLYYGLTKVLDFKLKTILYLFKFSVIFLPPLYAALEGFHYFSEWKRNIDVSKMVSQKYSDLITQIEESITLPTLYKKEVIEISNHLYDLFHEENQNWYQWYVSKKIEARI